MIGSIARKIFGSANDRYIKKQYKTVEKINELEEEFIKLSDEELRECYEYLDYKCMNIFKRMLCFFMKHRLSFMFYISVRYFSPILSKIIKRWED